MKNHVIKEYTDDLVFQLEEKEPRLYQIKVHNDDYTPMEFVVVTLEKFFYMDRINATNLTLEAHIKGFAVCGSYTKDCAETKVNQVIEYARTHEHPLICSMECAE